MIPNPGNLGRALEGCRPPASGASCRSAQHGCGGVRDVVEGEARFHRGDGEGRPTHVDGDFVSAREQRRHDRRALRVISR